MIACISIPYFAAAVERRGDNALAGRPLAIGGQPWEARPVYAFSQEVASMGVKSGMSLRLVQVLSPESHFLPADTSQYSGVSGELIDLLTDYSCLLEPQELWHSSASPNRFLSQIVRTLPACYCLDLEGLPYQQSTSFVQEMGKAVRQETSFAPSVGLAANKFTAQVAATVCRPSHALPVSPGEEGRFLSARPVDFLPLDRETSRRLRLLSIRTLGQLANLPPNAVHTQFGPEMKPFYRLAQGKNDEPVDAYPIPKQELVSHQFEDPVENLHPFMAVLAKISAELAARLQAASMAGSALQLDLEMDGGAAQQHTLNFRQPTADADHLAAAFEEMCSQIVFSCGITGLTVSLSGLEPAAAEQLNLFGESTVSNQLRRTIQNLIGKYKTGRFYEPVLTERDHPLPERRFQLQKISAAAA